MHAALLAAHAAADSRIRDVTSSSRGAGIALAILLLAAPVAAEPPRPVSFQDALARRLVPAVLATREVQAATEPRIPLVPGAGSVAEWEPIAARLRRDLLSEVVLRGAASDWNHAPLRVEWFDTLEGGEGYRIRKLRYEAVPGMWIPGLLYEPLNLEGRVPVVLNVNGHDREMGKAAVYKQSRCINQARRGMIALNVEWIGMGQLHTKGFGHDRMNQLDLCGTSGLAPFYLAMSRALDLLLEHEHADTERVAVTGLSGGGWQSILLAALDTRVTLCNPVAGYSSLLTRVRHVKDIGDSEQIPADFARYADYTHLTALLAPRAALLTYNARDDCCFTADYALDPLLEAAEPIYALYGKPHRLHHHVNEQPGDHNFEQDNREALYRAFKRHFYESDPAFDAGEIAVANEIKSKAELDVEMPAANEDLHSIAVALGRELALRHGTDASSSDPTESDPRRLARRAALRDVVRAKHYQTQSDVVGELDVESQTAATLRRFRLTGPDGIRWTVPAVEFAPQHRGDAADRDTSIVLLYCDRGRSDPLVAARAGELVAAGHRVIVFDALNHGELTVDPDNVLLMIDVVGERLLGIQASQLAAVARWSKQALGKQQVHVVGIGPAASLGALVAAALEPTAIDRLELRESLGSLEEVIEQDWTIRKHPEFFCFGLFEQFDIASLVGLVRPRPVIRPAAPLEARPHIAVRGIYGGVPDALLERGTLSDYGVNAIFMGSGSLTAERVAKLKEQGASVYAEFNTMHVAGYLKDHPDAAPIGSDGNVSPPPQGWQGICPTHPGYRRSRMDAFRKVLAEFSIDGIWLDYHHSHASWERAEPDMPDTCFCPRCIAEFSRATGIRLPEEPPARRATRLLTRHHEAWIAWRCGVFTDWVREFREIVDATRPAALLGTFHCPWTDKDFDAALKTKLAIDLRAQAAYIDVFSIMPYHARFGHADDPEWISRQTQWLGNHLGIRGEPGERHRIWPIVQLADWGTPVPVEQVATVLDHGTRRPATGVMIFNWGWLKKQMPKVDEMARVYREIER